MSEGPSAAMRAALLLWLGVDGEMKRLLAFTAFLIVTACGDERPPAPTAEEAARLDETEAMLNNAAETQEGPAEPPALPTR